MPKTSKEKFGLQPVEIKTVSCPNCGATIILSPHPEKAGRVIGRCPCNPQGAVIEMDEGGNHSGLPKHKEKL